MPEAADSNALNAVGTKIDLGAPKYAVYHLFSQAHRNLAPRWDRALRQMKADGSYAEILRKIP
jgi:hypothetical protein